MYVEYTPQGFNMMNVSPELLDEIILALRECYLLSECPTIQRFIAEAEKEQNTFKNREL
jgi:hypothetical protein